MSLADSIRKLAFTTTPRDMFGVEFCVIESFATTHDLEVMRLWSVQWRTFALLVAEAIATDGSLPVADRKDLTRVARYLRAENDDDS